MVGRSYRNPRGLYGVGVGVTEGVIGSYGAGGGRYGVGGGRYGVGRSYRNPMGPYGAGGTLWGPMGRGDAAMSYGAKEFSGAGAILWGGRDSVGLPRKSMGQETGAAPEALRAPIAQSGSAGVAIGVRPSLGGGGGSLIKEALVKDALITSPPLPPPPRGLRR